MEAWEAKLEKGNKKLASYLVDLEEAEKKVVESSEKLAGMIKVGKSLLWKKGRIDKSNEKKRKRLMEEPPRTQAEEDEDEMSQSQSQSQSQSHSQSQSQSQSQTQQSQDDDDDDDDNDDMEATEVSRSEE